MLRLPALAVLAALAGCAGPQAAEPATAAEVSDLAQALTLPGPRAFDLTDDRRDRLDDRAAAVFGVGSDLRGIQYSAAVRSLRRFEGYTSGNGTTEVAVFTYDSPQEASQAYRGLSPVLRSVPLVPSEIAPAAGVAFFVAGSAVVRVLAVNPGTLTAAGQAFGRPLSPYDGFTGTDVTRGLTIVPFNRR